MLTIQQVGKEILGHSPQSFYVMVGEEYGIKEDYIKILEEHYGQKIECPSVNEVLASMRTKSIIPRKPAVYVVRYDETFLASLNDKSESKLKSTKIAGTIVCLYEQTKHVAKVEKWLPNYTVSLDKVNDRFVVKYLKKDFPRLPDRFLELAAKIAVNYSQAKHMCESMAHVDILRLNKYSDEEISFFLGYQNTSSESAVKVGVASRNFKYLMNVIDQCPDNLDSILYSMLQTMIDLEKILGNQRTDSPLKPYAKLWSREDIYYMFMHIYNQIKRLRSSTGDAYTTIIYLVGLLQFERIPSTEAMK